VATTEQNRATARQFIDEVFNRKNLDHAQGVLADAFVEHSPVPGVAPDKAGTIEGFRVLLNGTPDLRVEIHDMVASGDRLAIRSTYSGTDVGGFAPGMPPTNKPYAMEGIDVVRFTDDGRVAEHWGIVDVPGAMSQLGLMPGQG
jgi:predicted SnoaL-like aldol condensation-catalyzing enzyme